MNEPRRVDLVDLGSIRRAAERWPHDFPSVTGSELSALLAVVEAARAFAKDGKTVTLRKLDAALEPFTAPEERAGAQQPPRERVRPGAFQAVLDRDPRDRARDQLADAGVVVQRQFRSDQERIAELEAMQERDEPDEQERKHLWTLHESVRSAKRRALPTTTVGVWALEALLKRVDGSKP